MNKALFLRELRAQWKLAALFAAVLSLYIGMIIRLFDPDLGRGIAALSSAMPQLFAAFGMMGPVGTLTQFMANYLYGFLLVVLPMLMILILCVRLLARYVDSGAMACLLATPASRAQIVRTQGSVLLLFVAALQVYVTALGAICAQVMFPGALDGWAFLRLNAATLGLHVFLYGICFFPACVFDRIRNASGIPGALLIAFVLLQMLAQMGEKLDFLRFLTPLTLYDPDGILAGKDGAAVGAAVLALSGLALMHAGVECFKRRDLPL